MNEVGCIGMTVDLNEIFTVNFTKTNFIELYLSRWVGEMMNSEVFKFMTF